MNRTTKHLRPLVGAAAVVLAALSVLPTADAFGATNQDATRGRAVSEAKATAPASGAPKAVTAKQQRAAESYWTNARMRRADEPAMNVKAGSHAHRRPKAASKPVVVRGRAPTATAQRSAALRESSVSYAAAVATGEGYWTGSAGANPARMVGKLFYRMYKGGVWKDYVCSGAIVAAENRSVVWTAGHCVFDTVSNRWADYFSFCPGYNRTNGCQYGTWTARLRDTTAQWRNTNGCSDTATGTSCTEPAYDYDVGALVMRPINGWTIQAWNGAHAIGFNSWTAYRYAFGYPMNKDSGRSLYVCQGTNTVNASYHLVLPCTAGGGASGGPWISGFNSQWLGTVYSVNSHGPATHMHGPFQGQVALDLYNRIRRA
jgi:hypothetical protein